MQTIHIQATLGSGDCEDCGFYDYGHFAITFGDGTVISGGYDGHLGGGPWDGQMCTLYQWCLAKLGYVVQVNGATNILSTLYRHKVEPEYGTETIVLFEGTPDLISLCTVSVPDPEYPEYDIEVAVRLPAVVPDAEPLYLATAHAPAPASPSQVVEWDGDWDKLYRLLLEQRATLTVDEHREPDDWDVTTDD
jgi:hypothetical protein